MSRRTWSRPSGATRRGTAATWTPCVALSTRDVEWHTLLRALDLGGDVYRGHEGVRQFVRASGIEALG